MPNPIYAWFKGETQKNIEGWGSWAGEDDQAGREGSSLVQQFDHEITIPHDPQSGQATGRRVHHPVRIVKRIDKASPKLYQALCSGERLTPVTFKWYRIDPTGAGGQQHYFSTTLEEAVIIAMKEWFPHTSDREKSDYSHFEDVAFTYRKIIWRWEDGGIETQDDWKSG
jgi:type VI secretion system secreted protein Hcp